MQSPINPANRPYCYICGENENLTDDHIPPLSFFPKGQRQNLFVSPLCELCHRPLSMDDEVMRYFLSMVDGVSESGRQIWKNEAYPRMQKQQKLWREIKKYQKVGLVRTPFGIEERIFAGLLQSRAVPFIRRITRGFLYLLYPEYDHRNDKFFIKVRSFNEIFNLLPILSPDSRGIEVFDMWHGFAADTRDSAIWIYRFYGATCFVCLHTKGNQWRYEDPPNYKEWHGLPKHL